MRYLTIICLITLGHSLFAQAVLPESLSRVKQKVESIESAKGEVTLELDVDFINMPQKTAQISFTKGSPVEYESDNFIFIPKRGLDFSWRNLFDYNFIVVERGIEESNGVRVQSMNIIPEDKRADFAIMTLKIDLDQDQIIYAEVSTKNEGTYELLFNYNKDEALPSSIEARFELEKVRIPLNFMGNDTDIDRKSMKSEGSKTGIVYLTLNWENIVTQ